MVEREQLGRRWGSLASAVQAQVADQRSSAQARTHEFPTREAASTSPESRSTR
jgi:hypothetical protein